MFDNWDAKDTSNVISGVGALAGAWGQYETEKQRNKLMREQYEYEKQKDALANEKMAEAQSAFDDAFDETLFTKKKKKDDPLDTQTAVV